MKTKSNWQKPIAIKLYKLVKISMSEKGITQVMLANKKKMENENVPKQFKINQNILKMLSCIENSNLNNQ